MLCARVLALCCLCGLMAMSASAADAAKPKSIEDAVVKAVDPLVEKALTAYNAGDWKAFFADYAKSMAAIANEQTYKALYGRYMETFGKYVSRTLVAERSSGKPDVPGLLSYDAEFEKNKKVRIDVNYLPEEGALKLMQVQFNAAK